MSEVGVTRRKEQEEEFKEDLNNNIDIFPEYFMKEASSSSPGNGGVKRDTTSSSSTYKGLQVSDQPRGRRQRRNSAGDEISSILNHETSSPRYGRDQGLIVMNSPLATSETILDEHHHNHHHHHPGSSSSSSGATNAGYKHDVTDLSSLTSSSLNTTVITKLEVSDR